MISKLLLMQKMLMMSLTLKSANPQGSGRDQTLRKAWNSSVIDIQQYQKKKQKGVHLHRNSFIFTLPFRKLDRIQSSYN